MAFGLCKSVFETWSASCYLHHKLANTGTFCKLSMPSQACRECDWKVEINSNQSSSLLLFIDLKTPYISSQNPSIFSKSLYIVRQKIKKGWIRLIRSVGKRFQLVGIGWSRLFSMLVCEKFVLG